MRECARLVGLDAPEEVFSARLRAEKQAVTVCGR
jgi:hypothetical protein